ncbi:MAG: glutamate synthase [Spirochaetes bacterium]|nr:MAG: glutamate synthase [Spirochaetota bacterium]
MGKETGFIEYPRVKVKYDSIEKRITHYNEFATRLSEEELKKQGARCMDCGIPFCHSLGCPLGNLIPEWNDLVYKGRWKEAWERLELTSSFPEITGRICPAPCETSCTLSINTSPVTIKQIELQIMDKAFKEGWVNPEPPLYESGKSVAIIGSGPAGMAAAKKLRGNGHKVTVFEKAPKAGGLMRYGIPAYKLEKKILDRRIEIMEQEGIVFENDVTIGEDLSVRYLKKSFDAILLTMGAGTPRDLPAGGRGLDGIHFALDFLTGSNKLNEGTHTLNQIISAKDKVILVIGGGDTGSDCVGTSIRQGAKSVMQYEIMPKPREWKNDWNPDWPDWPKILRTSSSQEEGCEREWGVSTKYLSSRDGIHLNEAHFVRVEWVYDEKKRSYKMKEIPGSEFSKKIDLVFIAMGFVHVEHDSLVKSIGVDLDSKGNIKTDGNYRTNIDGVFAAGDAATGASLVVRAFAHGRDAALAISESLDT